jgi:hypothetical protein
VPPPMVGYSGHGDGRPWYGMDNRVWGSHLYYTISQQYNLVNSHREHTLEPGRPLALTKYAVNNMQPGLVQQHHPAHHRFPVWWTGDNVPLEGSIESMVDSGVHGFMPYVLFVLLLLSSRQQILRLLFSEHLWLAYTRRDD